MVPVVLDHLVIGAASLVQGVDYIRSLTGIEVPAGGSHPRMGTHNRVMQIGNGVFFEIIAIEPYAMPPYRKRWFGLDDPKQRARIAERPRLIAWAVSTRDIGATLSASPIDLGTATEMTRGDMVWQIGIRDDGQLPDNGIYPVVLEWPNGHGPSNRMTDFGMRLQTLRLYHPNPNVVAQGLAVIGAGGIGTIIPTIAHPWVEADFRLPSGRIVTL